MDQALRAHRALSCSGYSRSDFIVSAKGLVYLETNTLPGLTKASLYPKALKAQGIEFADFLRDQIALARTARAGAGLTGRPAERPLTAELRSVPKLLQNANDCRQSTQKTHQIAPCRHPVLPFVYQEVRRLTLAAHVALGCRGVSCADFRYDDRIEGTVASSASRSTPSPA